MKKILMNALIFSAILGIFLTAAMAQNSESPLQAPEALFEGKTIDDFDCYLADGGKKEEVFRFEDGILKVSGTPFGWLSPKADYHNFILDVDVCYPTANPKANSGIFLRIVDTQDRPEPLFLPPCIECQLQTGNIGHLFGFHGHTLIGASDRYIYRARSEENGNIKPELHKLTNVLNAQKEGTDAWNHLTIICHEDLVMVLLNGKPVNWACNVQNVAGKIGFQSEGGEVWFSNAQIRQAKK